jgi:hypothetical protein
MAALLGRRGGLSRARRLSKRRLAEIARMGAMARAESLRLAESIGNNFDYVRAMDRLKPSTQVRPTSMCTGPLPGLYGPKTKN